MVYCAAESRIGVQPGREQVRTIRQLWLIVGLLAGSLVLLPGGGIAAESQSPAGADKVIRETKEAVEATKQYSVQQKEAFEKAVRSELNEMHAKIAELRKKTEAASAAARVELQKAVQDLEKKKDEARKKLDQVNDSTSAAWATLKDGMTLAVEDLKKSYRDALSKLP